MEHFFQVCSIKIESFAYDKENLLLKWHSPGVEFANVIEIPQLKLEGKRGSSTIDIDISSAILIRGRRISQYYQHAKIYSWKFLPNFCYADTLSMTQGLIFRTFVEELYEYKG